MWYEAKVVDALQTVEPNILYILADRDGVEPSPPYCIVSTFPISKIGQPIRSYVEKENKQTITQTTQIIFRLTLHAKANSPVHDVFESLHCGLDCDEYVYQFYQRGFGITDISEITYTSAPVNGTDNYKRATFDVTLLTTRIEEFFSNRISSVNSIGTIFPSDVENEEHTINISVSGNYED